MEKTLHGDNNEKKINGKTVLIYLIPYALFQCLILTILLPLFTNYTQEPILDMRFTYSFETVYSLFSSLSVHGRNLYYAWYIADLAFIISYTLFFYRLLLYLLQKIDVKQKTVRMLAFIPISAALSDLLENGLGFLMLKKFPQQMDSIASIAAVFSSAKYLFTLAVIIVIITSGCIIFKRKFIPKNNTAH